MQAATLIALGAFIAVPAPPMPAEPTSTSWVGKTVIIIVTGVQIGQLNERDEIVPPLTPLMGLDYRVYAERGNYVQLKTRESVVGWTEKSHVLPPDDAVAHFSKLLNENPNDITALNHRGWAWKLKGEHAAGIKDLTEAIRIAPEMAYFNNRGRILVAAGRYEQAIADFDMALRMGQSYIPYFNRANCWLEMMYPGKAIADFDQALQLNPKFANAYRCRGLAWQAMRELDKAIADFTQALTLDPKLATALADRGHAWLIKGERAKARADLDAAVAADAMLEAAFCHRGQLHVEEGTHDQALTDLAEAIRLNPRYALAFQKRALTWTRLKEYDKARADFERAVHFDVKNHDLLASCATFLATCPDAKVRDAKKSLALAQQAMDLAKANASVLEALAAAQAESGAFDEAVRTQERALKTPGLQNAELARQRLERYRAKMAFRQE